MASDPYKYFRPEARELLDQCGQCVLDLENAAAAAPLVQRLLRLAHTLKGAAHVVRQNEIAEHAHAMESLLSPLRAEAGSIGRETIDGLLRHLDDMGRSLRSLSPDEPAEVPQPMKPAAADEAPRTVHADFAEINEVLDGAAETHALLSRLRGAAQGLERTQHLADLLLAQLAPGRDHGEATDRLFSIAGQLRRAVVGVERRIGTTVEQMDRELVQLRDAAERLRLVSAGSLFTALERSGRDAARSLSKQIVFEGQGGELRLDSHVLNLIQPALIQLVRNAVAHGIEPAEKRLLAGKPAAGRISVAVSRRGQRIAFECRDDGGGVDFDAVRRVALQRGLLRTGSQPLSPAELVRLLLGGGISTSAAVTDLSGRGVGLDIVRESLDRLGGEIAVHTDLGRGTTFELIVPPTLTALDALLIGHAQQIVAIPLRAIRGTLRIGLGEITGIASGASIAYDGQAIAFIPLERALGGRGWAADRSWTVIIVAGEAGLAAIGVDRLLGTGRVVVRPLPDNLAVSPVVAGATLDAEGDPRLVLDPDALIAAALGGSAGEPDTMPARHPVLVIDDSLTTRMLEQSILESAGYEVDVAVSAEDGLAAAKRKSYALFLVDVDMPGMDGFGFVERIRADPALHATPAILVTSRSAADDRQKGRDVGAQGYVVKGEFDQVALLNLIRPLVG